MHRNQVEGPFHYFLFSIQNVKKDSDLSMILHEYHKLFGDNTKDVVEIVSKMLLELQVPMRCLLTKIQDKSCIILEVIKILTFILACSDINPMCIKKYLQ